MYFVLGPLVLVCLFSELWWYVIYHFYMCEAEGIFQVWPSAPFWLLRSLLVPTVKGPKPYPRRANLSNIWKSCLEEEGPVGGSIFPCFILLRVSSVIQGTSDQDSHEKPEMFPEKLTPFHSFIKRSMESSYLHLESCSKVRKRLHETGWCHICVIVSLLEKKKEKKSLSHHSKFALGKSVRVYWKEELKVRGSRLKQFYYWLITDFITQEAEQNKLKRRDSRLLKTLRKCGMTKPKMKTWNRISILIHINRMCMFIYVRAFQVAQW